MYVPVWPTNLYELKNHCCCGSNSLSVLCQCAQPKEAVTWLMCTGILSLPGLAAPGDWKSELKTHPRLPQDHSCCVIFLQSPKINPSCGVNHPQVSLKGKLDLQVTGFPDNNWNPLNSSFPEVHMPSHRPVAPKWFQDVLGGDFLVAWGARIHPANRESGPIPCSWEDTQGREMGKTHPVLSCPGKAQNNRGDGGSCSLCFKESGIRLVTFKQQNQWFSCMGQSFPKPELEHKPGKGERGRQHSPFMSCQGGALPVTMSVLTGRLRLGYQGSGSANLRKSL